MTRMSLRQFVVLFAIFCFALPAIGQTVTGTMQGTVTDKSGAAIPGVTITVHNMDTGLERVTTTNEKGLYSAPFLPVGRYRISAELSGFGTMIVQNVGVELNTTTVKNFAMAPQMTETVTVNAEAPHINVTDAEIKQTMTSKEIMERPNPNPANFLDLATVFSGFDENPTSGQNNPTASSGSSVNFNGTGTRGTTFQINGVNNDDSSENQNRQPVALATIKSFQIISNNYSAEFGRGYGAVVLVQTKSGTNKIDGEAYEYGQRSRWNSKTFSQRINNLSKAPNYRDEYGGTIGFPVMRDTLFGYFAADRIRNGGQNSITRSIITPADLALPRLTLGNDTPANRAFQNYVIGLFPSGITPNDKLNPVRGWDTVQAFNFPAYDYSGRLDWNAKLNQNLTARYQKTHQIFGAEDVIRGERADQNNRQSNFGVTWTDILSANTVQEARYGLGLRSTHVLIAAGNDTPIIRFSGLPTATSAPIIGNAGNFPIDRVQRDNQFVYNISSVLWQNHTLKAGTDIRLSELDDRADNFTRGFYTFGTLCNGVTYPNGIAAFMAGCVSTFQKAYGPPYLQNQINEENFYAQDDWRIRPNLTLNLGLRPEFVSAPKERKDRIDYQMSNRHYFDPRLGFAYTPSWSGGNRLLDFLTGGEGKTSIRGGFGIFHGRVFQSVFSQTGNNVRFNPPNAALLTFTNSTNIADPTNGFVFTPGQPSARVVYTSIDPNLQMPETHQWNLTFERQLFAQSRLRMSYIGTQARNLLQFVPWNLAQDPRLGPIVVPNDPRNGTLAGQTLTLAADPLCAGTTAATVNALCPVPVPIGPNEVSLRVPRTDQRRPDARYSQNALIANRGKSWYHGGQIEWESGPIHGFLGRMTYTYSKTIDNGSEATFVGTGDVNVFPIGVDGADDYARGLSRFDTRHRFTFNGTYLLPFFNNARGALGTLLGGWQLSTVIKLSSGTPFTVVDSGAFDIDFDGVANGRPVIVDRSMMYRHITRSGQLTPAMFRRAVYGDKLSNLAPRNSFYTDGTRNVDAGLFKTFSGMPMGTALALRLEVYNVFNHVQWGFPNNDIASATFGQVTAQANSPRTYQAAVRVIY